MRIILTSLAPPDPCANPGKAWVYVLAKGLAERGHEVTFWCVASGPQVRRTAQLLADLPLQWTVCSPMPRKRSWFRQPGRLISPYSGTLPEELWEGVWQACQRDYDILHLEYLWHGYLGLQLPRALIAAHGLAQVERNDTGVQSWRFFLSKLLLVSAERRMLRRFSHIRVLTAPLGELIQRINPTAHIYTVPLALDPIYYPMLLRNPAQKVIGFIADMRSAPQQKAAVRLLTRIWPLIRAQVKDVNLLLAGWHARRQLTSYLAEHGVTIWEDVPRVVDFFHQCGIFTYPAPLYPGLHSTVLEAMAYGVPVVSTVAGMEGIAAVDGVHAYIADDDELFAERVLALLLNPALRRQMAAAARALVETDYAPEPVMAQVEAMYQGIIAAEDA
jgi:glycosyltransferase involved in cell wall biosynthesis